MCFCCRFILLNTRHLALLPRLWPDTAAQAKHLWTPSTLWNRAAVIRSPTPSAMRSCTVSARIRTVSLLAGSALFHRSCILLVGAQSRSIRDSLLQMSPSSALLSSGQWSYRSTSAEEYPLQVMIPSWSA